MKANAIPFTIEQYNALVLTGKATVETRYGYPTRILCTDRIFHDEYPVVALCTLDGYEEFNAFTENGKFYSSGQTSGYDLFIISA